MNSINVRLLTVAVLGLVLTSGIYADYHVLPRSGGLSEIAVLPGDTFQLDLVFSTDASDSLDAVTFTVRFSAAGLRYDGYSSWSVDAGFDNSKPSNDFPIVLTASTYVAGFADPGDVDVYFDMFSLTPFYEGTLLTLSLTVPAGFQATQVIIDMVPDGFYRNGQEVFVTSDQFILNIVPEPSALLLAMFGCVGLLSRRQRKTSESDWM